MDSRHGYGECQDCICPDPFTGTTARDNFVHRRRLEHHMAEDTGTDAHLATPWVSCVAEKGSYRVLDNEPDVGICLLVTDMPIIRTHIPEPLKSQLWRH